MPPDDLGAELPPIMPAKGMHEWVLRTFVAADGPLHNEEHGHIADVSLGFLWAETSYNKQGRTVLGLTEQVTFRVSGWQRWRQEQQLIRNGSMASCRITSSRDARTTGARRMRPKSAHSWSTSCIT
jgi:hypothetical protein